MRRNLSTEAVTVNKEVKVVAEDEGKVGVGLWFYRGLCEGKGKAWIIVLFVGRSRGPDT